MIWWRDMYRKEEGRQLRQEANRIASFFTLLRSWVLCFQSTLKFISFSARPFQGNKSLRWQQKHSRRPICAKSSILTLEMLGQSSFQEALKIVCVLSLVAVGPPRIYIFWTIVIICSCNYPNLFVMTKLTNVRGMIQTSRRISLDWLESAVDALSTKKNVRIFSVWAPTNNYCDRLILFAFKRQVNSNLINITKLFSNLKEKAGN